MALPSPRYLPHDQAPPPAYSIRRAWSVQRWVSPSWVRFSLLTQVNRLMWSQASCPVCVPQWSPLGRRNCSEPRSRRRLSGTIPCTRRNDLAAAAVAKRLRSHAGLLAEESREVRRVGKSEIVGDFVDRLVGEHKLPLGFGENALSNE